MKRLLVLGTGMGVKMPEHEQIEHIAKAGWNGVFTQWTDGCDLKSTAKLVKALGLVYQSVHADFCTVDKLWDEGEAGEREVDFQIRCLRDCADAGVDLVIMHTIIGMEKNTPTQLGVERFKRISDAAKALGVRIALENTEGECYLATLMNAFENEKHIGFCVDTGHEMCYNHGADLIGKYGDRLFGTHLNDNMGQTGDNITWFDDSHMLPFDGIRDWTVVADRLNKAGFDGPLTFEIIKTDRPERTCNSIYSKLSFDEYLALALSRAQKFADMVSARKK